MKTCKQALGNLALEGKKPSDKGIEITSKFLEGKKTSEQAIKEIKAQYGY